MVPIADDESDEPATIGEPELKPGQKISPESEPTKSDQVREPAKSPVCQWNC